MRRWMTLGMAAIMLMAVLTGPAALADEEIYAVQLPERALLVDAQGEEIETDEEYAALYRFFDLPDGLALYMGEQAGGRLGSYALIDAQGKRLTEFEYQSLEYYDGSIIFLQNGRLGAMDTEGRIILDALYTSLIPNGAGGYLAQKTDLYDDKPDAVYAIDGEGREQETGVWASGELYGVNDGLCPVQSAANGRYGYVGADGSWAIEPVFEWAGPFADGCALVNLAGGAGLIGPDGRFIIEAKKNVYLSYEGGGAALLIDGDEAAVIDTESGEAKAGYTEKEIFGYALPGGMAVIALKERTVVVDRTGREILTMEGYAAVNQWAGMDEHLIVNEGELGTGGSYLYRLDGEKLAGPYRDVMPMGRVNGRMYYVYTSYDMKEVEYPGLGMSLWDEVPGTRKCGVLSPDGEALCEFDAEYITHLGGERILVWQGDEARLTDLSGEIIREFGGKTTEDEAE